MRGGAAGETQELVRLSMRVAVCEVQCEPDLTPDVLKARDGYGRHWEALGGIGARGRTKCVHNGCASGWRVGSRRCHTRVDTSEHLTILNVYPF